MQEYKFTQFFSRHFWKIASAAFAALMIAVFFNRYTSSKESEKKHDFLTIKSVFERFNRGESPSKESLDMAETILKRHPELHVQYDPLMAISLASLGQIDKAHLFCQKTERPFYSSFSKTTTLIDNQDFTGALEQACKLEDELKENPNFPYLRSFNLLRIAILSKKLNNFEKQAKALSTLESLKTYSQVAHIFEEGSFTLKDFFKKS